MSLVPLSNNIIYARRRHWVFRGNHVDVQMPVLVKNEGSFVVDSFAAGNRPMDGHSELKRGL